ncbi:MAG: DUF3035 domain-containing protein [Alphaproteobacteria bacterium]|nr:DUF3035 domain-containing protein [Alphaproteobacteria bacterium]
MPRSPRVTLVMLTLAAVMLSACGDSARRAFGVLRTSPDEFSVVPRAPLSQPPDFKLRPPRPGLEDLTSISTRERARQAVFRSDNADKNPRAGVNTLRGNDGPATKAAPREGVSRSSAGESAFLSRAGALKTDPLIGSQIDRESAVLAEESENFVLDLLGLKKDSPAAVVDAPAEARRLREAKAVGTSPSEGGKTPTIERKGNSLFKVF